LIAVLFGERITDASKAPRYPNLGAFVKTLYRSRDVVGFERHGSHSQIYFKARDKRE
jgi:hypothetical protein